MLQELIISGGVEFMLPITLVALLLLVLILVKTLQLVLPKSTSIDSLKKGLAAILFMGSLCFAYGVLGQTVGIYQMLQVISGSGKEISPRVIAAGLQISMIPTLYGLGIFIIASSCWFLLQSRYKQLLKKDTLSKGR